MRELGRSGDAEVTFLGRINQVSNPESQPQHSAPHQWHTHHSHLAFHPPFHLSFQMGTGSLVPEMQQPLPPSTHLSTTRLTAPVCHTSKPRVSAAISQASAEPPWVFCSTDLRRKVRPLPGHHCLFCVTVKSQSDLPDWKMKALWQTGSRSQQDLPDGGL